MRSNTDSTLTASGQKARHPALTFEAMARVRSAPRGGHSHLQLEALELSSVVLRARADLEQLGHWATLSALDQLEHHARLSVALYATGQALRIPVCVRGGIDDARGADAPGNGLGRLLAALRGRQTPLSGQTARRACVDGNEMETLARCARLEAHAWTDDRGRTWRRRFRRGLVYVPAEQLRALYVERSWSQLVAALGRALPRAWRLAAHLRRKRGGYWHAIRPDPRRPEPRPIVADRVIREELKEGRTFKQIVEKHGFIPFARIRALWSQIKEAWRIRGTKRIRRTGKEGSAPVGASAPLGAKMPTRDKTGESAAREAPQRAGQGGGCPTPVVHSSPPAPLEPATPTSDDLDPVAARQALRRTMTQWAAKAALAASGRIQRVEPRPEPTEPESTGPEPWAKYLTKEPT